MNITNQAGDRQPLAAALSLFDGGGAVMTSFIEGIKDKNASRLLNNSVVVFEYNDRNGVILPVLPLD